jgi:hypothetical protein
VTCCTIFQRLRKSAIRLVAEQDGVTAVEFALLLPVFLLLVFGILEIGLALIYVTLISFGADKGIAYLIDQRQNYETITEPGLRTAVCSAFAGTPLTCDERLKIALINADDPTPTSVAVPRPITDVWDSEDGLGGQYLLAIGYNWTFIFPTTKYVLPYAGPEAQIQAVNMAVLAERVTE